MGIDRDGGGGGDRCGNSYSERRIVVAYLTAPGMPSFHPPPRDQPVSNTHTVPDLHPTHISNSPPKKPSPPTPQEFAQLTLPRPQWLRKHPLRQKILHMPLRCAFRLPRPKDPSRVPLVRVQLRFVEFAHVGLVGCGEGGDGADGFAGAGSDEGGTG